MPSTYLAPPIWLPYTELSENSVRISWTPAPGTSPPIDRWRVFRGVQGIPGSIQVSSWLTTTTWKDITLTPGAKVFYFIDGVVRSSVYPNLIWTSKSENLNITTPGGSAPLAGWKKTVMPWPRGMPTSGQALYMQGSRFLRAFDGGSGVVSVTDGLTTTPIPGAAAFNQYWLGAMPSGQIAVLASDMRGFGNYLHLPGVTGSPFSLGTANDRAHGLLAVEDGIIFAYRQMPLLPDGSFRTVVGKWLAASNSIQAQDVIFPSQPVHPQTMGFLTKHPSNCLIWWMMTRDSSGELSTAVRADTPAGTFPVMLWKNFLPESYRNPYTLNGELPCIRVAPWQDRLVLIYSAQLGLEQYKLKLDGSPSTEDTDYMSTKWLKVALIDPLGNLSFRNGPPGVRIEAQHSFGWSLSPDETKLILVCQPARADPVFTVVFNKLCAYEYDPALDVWAGPTELASISRDDPNGPGYYVPHRGRYVSANSSTERGGKFVSTTSEARAVIFERLA